VRGGKCRYKGELPPCCWRSYTEVETQSCDTNATTLQVTILKLAFARTC
jgi:hypothetical protein